MKKIQMKLTILIRNFELRSHIENIFYNHLFDGPVQKPLQTTEWYREKKAYLESQLVLIGTQNELKKGECSQYIKRWVSLSRHSIKYVAHSIKC